MPATPKPKPKVSPKPKPLTGEAAIREYQRQISPQGMASASAAARKAIEDKYPGMFIPEVRTSPSSKPKKK